MLEFDLICTIWDRFYERNKRLRCDGTRKCFAFSLTA